MSKTFIINGNATAFSNASAAVPAGGRVSLTDDITLTHEDEYLELMGDDIEIDGKGFSVNISDVTDYPGFIKNGDPVPGEANCNTVTIKNLTVKAIGTTTLGFGGGWIAHAFFGKGVDHGIILV